MKKTKKTGMIIMSILAVTIFLMLPNSITVHAKKATSGQDANGNRWSYDKETKTLTFSGTTMIEEFELNGHDPEPKWWCWYDEAEHLIIEPGITGLGSEAFDTFNKLKTVEIPDTVTYIGEGTFECCFELEAIKIPETVTYIGESAFSDCDKLQSITIPEKVTVIKNGLVCCCANLKYIKFSDNVTKIEKYAFADCDNLRAVNLPKNLKVIEEDVFRNCKKLSSVTLPSGVEKIEMGAFRGSGITRIEIPENVTGFCKKKGEYGKDGVFQGCKKLKKIIIKSKKLDTVYNYAFTGIKKDVVIKVPKSKMKKYRKLFAKGKLNTKVKVKAIT